MHDEHGHEAHRHGKFDMHVWLDPGNAGRIVEAVADALARIDPARASTWRANARATRARIAAWQAMARERLAPVRDRPFMVFHDGYQYFETAFQLTGIGALSVDPSRSPGARRLAALRAGLVRHQVACVFTEPQFKPDLVHTLVEGTDVRTATLDLLGMMAEAGPNAWFGIMDGLTDAFANCLDR